jgi:uncharacterized Zn finger protein
MRSYDYYNYLKPSKPIQTEEGIKARSKRGDFVKNWWASRWIETLEELIDPGRLRRGRSYARKGQVLTLEETRDGVKAKVQGSRRTPYKIAITVSKLSDRQWEQVIDAMAGQALLVAQLLAGEMPQDIEEVFEAAGASLFPTSQRELVTTCSCPDYASPCKHVAAVHYLLGERFDEDPFLLFRLRGRTQEQIMAALQARRPVEAGPATGDEEDGQTEMVTPLPETLDRFWEMGQPLTGFKTTLKPPITPFPVLKRLGQPAFINEDIVELLGPAYQAISDKAMAIAFEDETTGPGSMR